jgi:hypothetical protein
MPVPDLLSSNYPNVRYWSKSQWKAAAESTKGAVDHSRSREIVRGKKAVAQGQNNACTYIENENGEPVDGYRLSAIRQLARTIWVKFAEMGLAPATWGKASLTLVNEYKAEMRRQFPEFRLCENDWKVQQLATTDYPSWHSNYSGDAEKKMESKKKRPSLRAQDDSGDDSSTKKQKVEPAAKKSSTDNPTSNPDSHVNQPAVSNDESTCPLDMAAAVEGGQTGSLLTLGQPDAMPAGQGESSGPSAPSFTVCRSSVNWSRYVR